MLKNYLKIILRSWNRDRITTLINIVGLSFSFVIVLLLAMHIFYELRVESHNKNRDSIYGVFYQEKDNPENVSAYTQSVLAGLLKEQVPDIKEVIRIKQPWNPAVFSFKNGEPLKTDMLFADESFFRTFSYECIEGNLQTALENPMSLVLCEEEARRIFGEALPIGQTLLLDDKYELTVTAVIKSPESQSALRFSSLVSLLSLNTIDPLTMQDTWNNSNVTTLALLNDNANIGHVENAMQSVLPDADGTRGERLHLYPFRDIYFNYEDSWSIFENGSKAQVHIFLVILITIMIIALINFVNLSTAKSSLRFLESGIIKVIGGNHKHILGRFVVESWLYAILSFIVSLILLYMFAPLLSQWLHLNSKLVLLKQPVALLLSFLIFSVIGILTGVLPGLRFAFISPEQTLRNKTGNLKSGIIHSKILLAVQFSAAIILIIATMIITQQIKYSNVDWGIQTDRIVGIKISQGLSGKKEVLKQELLRINGISDAVLTQFNPGSMNSHWTTKLRAPSVDKYVSFQNFTGGADLPDFFDMHLIAGRSFPKDMILDDTKALINEAAARSFGIENPIGAKLMGMHENDIEIIGIIEDFHFKSKHEKIAPLVIRNAKWASWCYVKLNASYFSQTREIISHIEKTAKRIAPAFPVEWEFMDESIGHLYEKEVQFQQQVSFFSGIAIFLASLGILGLSIFSTERRTKEIGIRKVLGASVPSVIYMVVTEFLKWVGIASCFAIPVAWYAMNKWLENFAYRIDLTIWPFLLSGLLALCIALLAVCWQAIKAATANPVESLRYE